MFKIGDIVRYSQHGVCRFSDVCEMEVAGKSGRYLVLTALGRAGGTLYVPEEREELVQRIVPLVTKEEIEALLARAKAEAPVWERDFRRRSEGAKKALLSADRFDPLMLIKTVYEHKKEERGVGRNLHTTDDYFLRDAEQLIFFEFSYVLGRSYEEVRDEVRALFCYEE